MSDPAVHRSVVAASASSEHAKPVTTATPAIRPKGESFFHAPRDVRHRNLVDPILRGTCIVALALAGCGMEPPPTPPREPSPSRQCVLEADAVVEKFLNHWADNQPDQVWRAYHGKAEYGQHATLGEEQFISFMATRNGKEWLRGTSDVFDVFHAFVLTRCVTRTGNARSRQTSSSRP